MTGDHARTLLAGTRFAGLRWEDEVTSTNTELLEAARQGAPDGSVLIADRQTAGRGRQGRRWADVAGGSLLASVLLRPPAEVVPALTLAAGVATAEAIAATCGVATGLKWPNDVVEAEASLVRDDEAGRGDASAAGGGHDGDEHGGGYRTERKLAGILAEADWPPGASIAGGWREPAPNERAVVVVGVGINVNWPKPLPAGWDPEVADRAAALSWLAGGPVDRERLAAELCLALDRHVADLGRAGGGERLVAEARRRSVTLGRRVRVDLGSDDVTGTAVDLTSHGHLVVDTLAGARRTFVAGEVSHLR